MVNTIESGYCPRCGHEATVRYSEGIIFETKCLDPACGYCLDMEEQYKTLWVVSRKEKTCLYIVMCEQNKHNNPICIQKIKNEINSTLDDQHFYGVRCSDAVEQ